MTDNHTRLQEEFKGNINYDQRLNSNTNSDASDKISTESTDKIKTQTDTDSINNDQFSFDLLLNKIGFGKYQLRIYFVFALLSITEGSQVMLYTITIPVLQAEWKLSDLTVTVNTSLIFLSFLIGSLVAGQAADRFGRRLPCLVSYSCMAVFCYLCVVAPNIYFLTGCRVILGFFVGFFAPLAAALLAEITQINLRGRYMAIIQAFISLGFFFGVFMAWLVLPNLKSGPWRMLILYCTPPGLLGFILSFVYIDESPRYLMVKNKYNEAFKVIDKMFKINTKKEECLNFLTPRQKDQLQQWSEHLNQTSNDEKPASISALFKGVGKRVTPILWFNWFASQFVYYGIVVNMADLLAQMNNTKEDTSQQNDILKVLLSTLLEILPVLLAAVLIENKKFGRKNSIIITFACCTVFAVLVFINPKNFIYYATCCKFFLDMTIIFCLQYTAEIYHTKNRTTALGLASGLGRVGGIAMPFAYQFLQKLNLVAPYLLFAAFCIVGSIISIFLPFDTTGKALDVNQNEKQPIEPPVKEIKIKTDKFDL